MTDPDTHLPSGAYGKVPSAADFVTRGLPESFVEPWDKWLGRSIATAVDAFGDMFQLNYLTSPVWCFVLDEGLAGPHTWLGAFATSVDSHQRPYPITLAVAITEKAAATEVAEAASALSAELEELCFAAIDSSREWADISESLTMLARQIGSAAPARLTYMDSFGVTRARLVTGAKAPPIAALSGSLSRSTARTASAISCWWHRGTSERAPEAIRSVGLPPMEAFPGFLDGSWSEHGWTEAQ